MSFPVTLVGSHGHMGAMFCAAWSGHHDIREVNRVRDASGRVFFRKDDLVAGIPHGDVVILCIPAPAMPDALDCIVPHMRENQILADVCSVKMAPMRWMEERFAGAVIGTHPLFGPENVDFGKTVALVRGKKALDADVERTASLFREMGCAVFEGSAEEHDGAVGITQSLHFVMAAAYFAVAATHPNLGPYITLSFLRFQAAAESELTSSSSMFAEFTKNNPLFPGILTEFAERLQNLGATELSALAAKAQTWYSSPCPSELKAP